jgi:aldose sugar dehydrogenase
VKRFSLLLLLIGCAEPASNYGEVGAPAPAYGALTTNGDSIDLAGLKGEVVLLNVWATWCIPCRREIPELVALDQQYSARGLRVVGVSVDESGADADVASYARDFAMTYTILRDPGEAVSNAFRIQGVPASFLIDRAGIVRWRHLGPFKSDDRNFVAVLNSLLSEQASGKASYQTVATGLYVPWAMAFAPDGRVFVTERPGRIRVLANWKLDPQPWAQIDVVASGESGLMGIALSPNFARDHYVYVVATFVKSDHLLNRVIRYTEVAGRGTAPQVLIDNIPAAEFHAGDAIAFGPDGMLYIATGDAGEPGNARKLNSLSGKILRYTPAGGIPRDNPFPGSPVYALGVRNVQGLAWNSAGQLFATDHGPSGFPNERMRRNHDELNAIVKGKNYGWPAVAGSSDDVAYIPPLVDWTPGIAPSGVAIYSGPQAQWRGNAFVAGLKGKQLQRIAIERSADRLRVTGQEVLFDDELGRLRAVAMGPDGYIYFTTSNWDGRGTPAKQDDRILRLLPR